MDRQQPRKQIELSDERHRHMAAAAAGPRPLKLRQAVLHAQVIPQIRNAPDLAVRKLGRIVAASWHEVERQMLDELIAIKRKI